MKPADPRKHLKRGTPDRRCWHCAAFVLDERLLQPLGDCTHPLFQWIMEVDGRPVRQMVHADDVCARFEAAARTVEQRDERVLMAGLG